MRLRTLLQVFVFAFVVMCCAQAQDIFRNILRIFNIENDGTTEPKDFLEEYDFIVIGAGKIYLIGADIAGKLFTHKRHELRCGLVAMETLLGWTLIGSGGSVVANRLSENPDWSVLVVEAGKDETFLTDVPIMAALQTVTAYNWGYKSEKLKTACLGLIDEKCNLPRGKALGGTSVINFLLYTRGNKEDFNMWEQMGNIGWGYQDVLPYFIKSENCTLCKDIDRKYHGDNGYLHIENPGYESPLVKRFIKAGQEMGYRYHDPNGRYGLGFSKVQATMKNGMRCSASKAFLRSIQNRPNLHILTHTKVTKILIDPTTKQAYGIEFIKNRTKYSVKSKNEIILSAGSFNSPQLLMLSGVGPKEDLERIKIPVIQDLRVGYNLQDHMAMSTLAFLVNETVTVSDINIQRPANIFNYMVHGKGPFTIPGGAEALAFVRTKYANFSKDYPDMELVLGAGAINGDIFGSLRALLGMPDSIFQRVYGPVIGIPAFGIATVLLRPKSKGRVMLKDTNPFHWPVIKPNYFEDKQDVATMVEGIKMAISVAHSDQFKRYNTRLNKIPIPGCEHNEFNTDSYWTCAIRQVSTTLGHQVGTCKMGPSNDPEAVVDPQLKVHGIKRLRVVDGSIMPNIVAGHTNAVIFMIGEKASDMIKSDWNQL